MSSNLLIIIAGFIILHHYIKHYQDKNLNHLQKLIQFDDINNHETWALFILGLGFGMKLNKFTFFLNIWYIKVICFIGIFLLLMIYLLNVYIGIKWLPLSLGKITNLDPKEGFIYSNYQRLILKQNDKDINNITKNNNFDYLNIQNNVDIPFTFNILNIEGKIGTKKSNTYAHYYELKEQSNNLVILLSGNSKNIEEDYILDSFYFIKNKMDVFEYNYLGFYKSRPFANSFDDLNQQIKYIFDYINDNYIKIKNYKKIILHGTSLGGLILPYLFDYIKKNNKYDISNIVPIIFDSFYDFSNFYPFKSFVLPLTTWKPNNEFIKNLLENKKTKIIIINTIFEYCHFKNTISYKILKEQNIKLELENFNEYNKKYTQNYYKYTKQMLDTIYLNNKFDNNKNYKLYNIDNKRVILHTGNHAIPFYYSSLPNFKEKMYDDLILKLIKI